MHLTFHTQMFPSYFTCGRFSVAMVTPLNEFVLFLCRKVSERSEASSDDAPAQPPQEPVRLISALIQLKLVRLLCVCVWKQVLETNGIKTSLPVESSHLGSHFQDRKLKHWRVKLLFYRCVI